MRRVAMAGICALALCGCVPTNTGSNLVLTSGTDEPLIYARADGKVANPALVEQNKAICDGRISAATIDAPKISTDQKGGVGLIDMGMQVIDRQQTVNSLEKGCMAERGYILVPRSQAPAAKVHTAQR